MQIKDFSDLISGYTFRDAIEKDPNGDLVVLQAKDISSDKMIEGVDDLTQISSNRITSYKNFLQKGDVLIVARGMKTGVFRSTVFNSDASNVIVSSSVHIIRIKDEKVLPEYLTYYLNSKYGQFKITQNVSGSYIGSLPKNNLGDMEIPILDLKKQQTIIDLHRNIKKQREILDRKNNIKENIISATFKNLTA